MLESILLILDLLVPDHGEEAFDVGLSFVGVSKHLKVGPAELPCQDIRLALHQSILLFEELFSNDIGTPAGLYHQGSRLLDKSLLSSEVCSCHEAFDS